MASLLAATEARERVAKRAAREAKRPMAADALPKISVIRGTRAHENGSGSETPQRKLLNAVTQLVAPLTFGLIEPPTPAAPSPVRKPRPVVATPNSAVTSAAPAGSAEGSAAAAEEPEDGTLRVPMSRLVGIAQNTPYFTHTQHILMENVRYLPEDFEENLLEAPGKEVKTVDGGVVTVLGARRDGTFTHLRLGEGEEAFLYKNEVVDWGNQPIMSKKDWHAHWTSVGKEVYESSNKAETFSPGKGRYQQRQLEKELKGKTSSEQVMKDQDRIFRAQNVDTQREQAKIAYLRRHAVEEEQAAEDAAEQLRQEKERGLAKARKVAKKEAEVCTH